MKRLWWIPLGLLWVVSVAVVTVEWAIEGLVLALFRASKWIETRMKENQDA